MHQFICKAQGGNIVPLEQNKRNLLNKVLRSYEELDMKFKVTIEVIVKNINEQQISLYNAFIIKASDHFGNTFIEMENILKDITHTIHKVNVKVLLNGVLKN